MTGYTIIPGTVVSPRINREIQAIVFGVLTARAGRVTGQAGIAVICIGCNPGVDRICYTRCVANLASELGPVIGICVTGDAVIPGTIVRSGIYREIGSIVRCKFTAFTGWVTGQAGAAFPDV